MIISILLIKTEKSMMKYYKLYCFLIFSILIQTLIFISNLHINIDPYPDNDIIIKMNEVLNIPWYLNLGIENQTIYFFGLGLSHYEMNIIWTEFIEIILIYIYLDYFSYSIYQGKNIIGARRDEDKINYEKLFINDKKTQEAILNLLEKEYEENRKCMKYNFGIIILDYNNILKTILNDIIRTIRKEKGKENKNINKKNEVIYPENKNPLLLNKGEINFIKLEKKVEKNDELLRIIEERNKEKLTNFINDEIMLENEKET